MSAPVDDATAMDKAEAQLLQAIQQKPDDPALYNQLGLLYASTGEYDKAVGNLQKAIEIARVKVTQLGDSEGKLRAKGETEKAAQLLLDRSKVNVELSAGHSSLARVYDLLGQHDRVVTELEQLNNDIAFGSALSTKVANGAAGIGAAAAASHKLSLPVMRLLARAEALTQAKRIPEAMEQYKKIIQIDPLASLAHQRLGQLAAANNNFYLAQQELEIAARLDPANAGMHCALAEVYSQDGQQDLAIEQYEKAISLNPNSQDASFRLGNLLCASGRLKPAEQAYERLTKVAPESALAHNNLATVRSMMGDYKGAMGEFKQALVIKPDLASSHYGLGLAFYNTNNYPGSIREFRRALALNPSLTDAQTKLQLASKRAGAASLSGFGLN
jgi:tetratricopeptide (TPR) repeat protein